MEDERWGTVENPRRVSPSPHSPIPPSPDSPISRFPHFLAMHDLPSSTVPARVLVVEDEAAVADAVALNLREEGYQVSVARRGDDGYRLATAEPFDLIILDLMLPGADGREICRAVRRSSTVPILMLTARVREVDRVLGLELGADDYLSKPFGMLELIARVKALLRRAHMASPARDEAPVTAGRFALDPSRHLVTKDGQPVSLRPREFELLRVLMLHRGRVLSRDRLLDLVWGEDRYLDRGTLDVHIRWLRSKLEDDPGDPKYIRTVRGVGYSFSEDIP
jgi:DNA-binding response OmpR family regulator